MNQITDNDLENEDNRNSIVTKFTNLKKKKNKKYFII